MKSGVTKSLIPRLRFPEFKNAGEWETYFGNDLFAQINDRQADSDLPILAITQKYGAVPRDEIDYHVSARFIQQLTKNLEGMRDGKMVSYKQFSDIVIFLPSLPEQQRIADFLTSLDDQITAQAEKLEALKTHKKGLLQQLFPKLWS